MALTQSKIPCGSREFSAIARDFVCHIAISAYLIRSIKEVLFPTFFLANQKLHGRKEHLPNYVVSAEVDEICQQLSFMKPEIIPCMEVMA